MNPREFSTTEDEGEPPLIYPFSYPDVSHPTCLCSVAEVVVNVGYPLNTKHSNDKVKSKIDLNIKIATLELTVEPYQLLLLQRGLDVIDNW